MSTKMKFAFNPFCGWVEIPSPSANFRERMERELDRREAERWMRFRAKARKAERRANRRGPPHG